MQLNRKSNFKVYICAVLNRETYKSSKSPQGRNMNTDVFEPFVASEIVAEYLSFTPATVKAMARRGEIPAHPFGRGVRKTWRFRMSEIHAFFSTPKPVSGDRVGSGSPSGCGKRAS
jgi:excisionase family DNA binding protein